MEFGKVAEDELGSIDFKLPVDPAFNKKILEGTRVSDPKVYLGCAKWGRPEWVGKIYPPKAKERNYLDFYVHHYNSIELNASYYKVYGPVAVKKWTDKAGDRDFRFCPKMYQGVTHRGNLKGKEFITAEFLRGIVAFGKHLGPVFLLLNETYSPKRKDEIFGYLKTLPTDLEFFVELRNKDWFRIKENSELLFNTLREMNMGAVITDTSGRRDCLHMHLTVGKAFIRFTGNSLHPTDYTRCDDWVQRIKSWLDNGLPEIYFFMHMHDEATSPELTAYLVKQLNSICGLKLKEPQFLNTFDF